MWQPDSLSLRRIRDHMVERTDEWTAVRGALAEAGLELMGESLKRPPRGFDGAHEHIEDLKRKSFAVHRKLSEGAVTADDAVERVAAEFAKATPLVALLCESQGLPFE